MAWDDNTYASGDQILVDMAQIEANFAVLKSGFSGTSAPANQVVGQQWYDHAKKVTKRRDHDDTSWHGLMHGDVSQKIWVYRNAAMEGWAIDGGVTDVVLALKGGATYTAGAALAGTWTWPSATLDATMIPAHTHGSSGAHTHTTAIYRAYGEEGYAAYWGVEYLNAGGEISYPPSSSVAHEHTSVGGGLGHSHGSTTFRPYAAVGTLQYLDL